MMYTIDIETNDGKPVAGASVSFTNVAGDLLGLLIAGDNGSVSFDDAVHPEWVFDGTTITAEADGFYPSAISAPSITENWYFKLAEKPHPWLWIAGGISVGILLHRVWLYYKNK